MSDWWTRKVDILNRGFSGYNSRWGLSMFKEVVMNERPDLVVLFFGANDSIDEKVLQHVPLDEFQSNLNKIVTSLVQVCILMSCMAYHIYLRLPYDDDDDNILLYFTSTLYT